MLILAEQRLVCLYFLLPDVSEQKEIPAHLCHLAQRSHVTSAVLNKCMFEKGKEARMKWLEKTASQVLEYYATSKNKEITQNI